MQASVPVLEELAQVLRLDEHQRAFLFELAGRQPGNRAPQEPERAIDAQLRRLLDLLGETPAVVFGRHMDVLAWNRMAAALVTVAKLAPPQRNYAWLIFNDPQVRRLYRDWEDVARLTVAHLHMDAARNPADPRLTDLVAALSAHPEFARWWEEQLVEAKGEGTKTLRHPVVGEITLNWDTLTSATAADQQLIVWTAEPGSAAHDALRIPASWAAEHLPAGGSEAPVRLVGHA